jgi:hypothetical protein
MKAVTRNPETNAIQIKLDWTALIEGADTGNSVITSYELWWDN